MLTIAASGEAIRTWLESTIDHERSGTFRSIRLERIAHFLHRLPTPPAPLTVAGTKGKGSTVRLAEAALGAAGVPTLAFTSPHVATVLERWRIDGQVAPAAMIAEACTRVASLEDPVQPLTYFERTFAVACLLAAGRPGTAFLCEVGLGGRLDCANTLDCAVAVLTHLSHDHRDVLGPILDDIAREKLAIARPRRPLVIAPQSPAAHAAIQRQLPSGVTPHWVDTPRQSVQLALPGNHQQDNAATALVAVRLLHPELDEATCLTGMRLARLAARCQVLDLPGRRILVDGAHNGPSMVATMAVAHQELRPDWQLLLGLARDKEVEEVLAAVSPGQRAVRCGYVSPRARRRDDWPAPADGWPWFDDVRSALAAVDPHCDLCITGSFYLAGEALAALGHAGDLPG